MGSFLQKGLGDLTVLFLSNTRGRVAHVASYFTHNMFISQCVCLQSYDILTDDYAFLKKILPREGVAKNEDKFSVKFFKKFTWVA